MFTIGRLARRTGVPARTIRFWSDAGLVPPAGRSAGGYRLYDAEGVARLELVRTLRGLGLGLEAIQAVLARSATLGEVAATQVGALDAEIRVLRLRRAVLSTVARRDSTIEETLLMHRLAEMSARERQQIIDEFVREITEGIAPDAPAMGVAASMRDLPELPDDPAPAQVDAWIELGELVADPDFRSRVRAMAVAGGGADHLEHGPDYYAVVEHAGAALAAGVDPASPEARAVVEEIFPVALPEGVRAEVVERLELLADARIERYWQLLSLLRGRLPAPSAVPAFGWLTAAMRAG